MPAMGVRRSYRRFQPGCAGGNECLMSCVKIGPAGRYGAYAEILFAICYCTPPAFSHPSCRRSQPNTAFTQGILMRYMPASPHPARPSAPPGGYLCAGTSRRLKYHLEIPRRPPSPLMVRVDGNCRGPLHAGQAAIPGVSLTQAAGVREAP